MIADERMMTFIRSFDRGNPAYLEELEKYSRETNVPIIRPQMQSLLKFLLAWGKPREILEVGTAIGFSALLMSEYAPQGCHITTIEKYEKRIPLARENFKKAGKEENITLLEGDATEILAELKGEFVARTEFRHRPAFIFSSDSQTQAFKIQLHLSFLEKSTMHLLMYRKSPGCPGLLDLYSPLLERIW